MNLATIRVPEPAWRGFTVPLGSRRRIFARQPRLHLGTLVPWVVVILLLAGASAAAGAILAENAGADRVTFGVAAAK